MYIYIYTGTCIYIDIYLYVHVHRCIYVYTYIYIHMHTHVYIQPTWDSKDNRTSLHVMCHCKGHISILCVTSVP